MKKTLIIFLMALTTQSAGQTLSDYFHVISSFRNYYNASKADSVFSLFSPRVQGLMPLDKTTQMIRDLNAQLGEMKSFALSKDDGHLKYYTAEFANATLTLIAALNADLRFETFRFVPKQDETASKKDSSNFVLATGDAHIYGTLTMPAATGKVPVVLIIAGSGPTDRNGNSRLGVNANTYLMLADSLAQHGIASVRYDKRGVGESATAVKDEESITFDGLVSDATGFVKMLQADQRFSSVTILGHSEGSLIGMLSAERAGANGYISVSGIAESADKLLKKQIAAKNPDLSHDAAQILDSLSKGYTVKNVRPELNMLFRPSVQDYMISWMKYEPAKEIAQLKMPVLIVQGSEDLQVETNEASELKKANSHATLKIVPGMNHVLKHTSSDRADNAATYTNPDLPLCPGLTSDLVHFIKALK